jgi:hypothetical protein
MGKAHMPEADYSPKIGHSRSWHDVLPVMLLMIHAGMISTVALGIGTPRHVCRIFRKPAAVHHLRDMLQSDEQCVGAGSIGQNGRLLTLLVPFCSMWSAF